MYLKKHFLPRFSHQFFRVYISLIALFHLLSFQSLSVQDICRTIQYGGGQFRVPAINPNQDGIPFCPESPFYGAIGTETGSPVEGVDVQLAGTGGSCVLITNNYKTPNTGNYGFCTTVACNNYTVTPLKDDNPLNGVSTYDLVLISKHILGIEPLNSPYKMIAADANKSNSITTFDIVEFRKLILGIYDKLPANTSWRFLRRDFVFPNPANAFQTSFNDYLSWTSPTPIPLTNRIDFVGIKVGDVNGTAISYSKPEHLQQVSLSWPNLENARAGAVITIPVRYTGSSALEAIQLGLRFDPTRLRLISPAMGEVPAYGAGNFGLTKLGRGEIRSLWIPDGTEPDQYIQPGAVLFYLSFQVLEQGSNAAREPLLQLDDKVLYNYAWQPDGVQYAVIRESESLERAPVIDQSASLSGVTMPNPSAGAISMKIHAPKAGKARLMFFSPFGVRVLVQNLTLESGDQQIQVPEFASLPAGLYKWVLLAAGEKTDGHVVKE